MHTDVLAGRGETWRWMSAAAGASGDRVFASNDDDNDERLTAVRISGGCCG